uniref:Phosphopantetheine attachment site n=1 Tax=Candidatus Kentrum sp. LFY TaxID=2126342 RepID=A0A450V8F4_9GAMM|nr:MAG: Phosphopantetheine attachment site [Candidatus Kentron sp. LFY]
MDDYRLHPVALDAGLQVLLDASLRIIEETASSHDETYLPVSIEKFRIYRGDGRRDGAHLAGARLWSLARVIDSDENTVTADVSLFDEFGSPVAGIAGFTTKRIGGETLRHYFQAKSDRSREAAKHVADRDSGHWLTAEQRREMLLERLRGLSDEGKLRHVERIAFRIASEILRIPMDSLDGDRKLAHMGIDSLMGVEFRGKIQKEMGIELSNTDLLNASTPTWLAGLLIGKLNLPGEPETGTGLRERLEKPSVTEKETSEKEMSEKETPVATEVKGHLPLEKQISELPEHLYRTDCFVECLELQEQKGFLDEMGVGNPYSRVDETITGATARIEGKEFISFSSYNYVGLSGHHRVTAAAQGAILRYGTSPLGESHPRGREADPWGAGKDPRPFSGYGGLPCFRKRARHQRDHHRLSLVVAGSHRPRFAGP